MRANKTLVCKYHTTNKRYVWLKSRILKRATLKNKTSQANAIFSNNETSPVFRAFLLLSLKTEHSFQVWDVF